MIAAVLLAAGLSLNGARAIDVASRERPAWAMLELPQEIDAGAGGDYADLRIVDDRGRETPYVIDPYCAHIAMRNVAVSDVGFAPGAYTEAQLDGGSGRSPYSAISIETTSETYFDRVDVAISDDAVTWREVRNGALIYRVADSGDPGTQTIPIGRTRARWIRIRVHDSLAAFPVDGAALDETQSIAPSTKRLAASSRMAWREEDRTSILSLDTGTPHTNVSWIRLQTTQPEFSRKVTVQTSNDNENWSYAGNGVIQRFAHDEPNLNLPLGEAAGRYLRIEVSNGSDAPLPNLRAELFGARRTAVFVAVAGRTYALTRVPRAPPPDYDLRTLLEHDDPRSFAAAHLAGATHEYRFESNVRVSQPLILTLAFAAAFLSLGAVTLATLRPRGAGRRPQD